ncbi:MAG: phosphoesterase [Gemmatimonadetes bacterium]|nr:phosphoesterase [Gemmatimonadota bacterium]
MNVDLIPQHRHPVRRALTGIVATGWLMLAVAPVSRAQSDTSGVAAVAAGDSAKGDAQSGRWRWPLAAGAVAVAALGDERISAFAVRHQSARADQAAAALDPFGRAGTLVPAIAAAVVVTRVAGPRTLADATLRAGLAYAAADGVESILKPLIGRHRPSDGGSAWRFKPLSNDGDWHSTPSAHTVHAFALATGLALESRSAWVATPAYVLASLVGSQRVYTNQHWASDVVASAALSAMVARWTEERLRRHGLPYILRPAGTEEQPGATSALPTR